MKKILKGDRVIVIAGKDKGRQGEVKSVVGGKVLVEGVNTSRRHTKPNPNRNDPGGIIVKEMPIDVSNVAIWNPKTKKADRVGIKLIEEAEGSRKKVRRMRIFKSDGQPVKV